MINFSVAIPTYESSDFLKQCIYGFKNSKNLNEIIVGDDGSSPEELEYIKQIIKEANQKFSFEIKLMKNKENLGAFVNKFKIIESATNEWVYQIDSDNVPFSKIDNVISEIVMNHNSQLFIYYPSKLIQFWKFYRVAKFLSYFQSKYLVKFSKNLEYFDIDKTKQAIEEFLNYDTSNDKTEGSPEINSRFVIDKHIYWVLNSGNFIVNKKQFLCSMSDGLKFPREVLSMDAVAFSYLWLKNRGSIVLHPSLGHFHRKRLSSVSYTEKESSKISRQFFTDKIMHLS